MSLAFGPRGNVTAFDQTSDAGLAKAMSTIAEALTAARQEFAAGVDSVKEAQASVLSIQAAGRAARIQELKDRSAVLDAQLALVGVTATRDLVAQRQQIEAELALLQAQQSLANAVGTADTSSEVAALRAELERLKLELEILKIRTELEQAKSESGTAPPR